MSKEIFVPPLIVVIRSEDVCGVFCGLSVYPSERNTYELITIGGARRFPACTGSAPGVTGGNAVTFGGGGGVTGSKGAAPGIGAVGVPNPYAGLIVGGANADGNNEVAGNGLTGTGSSAGGTGVEPGEVPVAPPGDGVGEGEEGFSPGKVPGAAPNGFVPC